MSSPPADVPKAVLYFSPSSVWSAAVLLGLEEKGYGSDEIELKIVGLKSGENFSRAYLGINPNGTVPTLVVPLKGTLASGTPVKYRALTDTRSVLEFLDKSRSVISRTHTTSSAPAPVLAPATVSLLDLCNTIIELVHSVSINFLSVAATSQEELETKAHSPLAEFVRNRQEVLQQCIAKEGVNDAVRKLWENRHIENGLVDRVYENADKLTPELAEQAKEERAFFFKKSVEVWTGTKNILEKLEFNFVGPFALGDQFSLADLHVGAWLTRVFFISGVPTPLFQETRNPGGTPALSYAVFPFVDEVIRKHTGDATLSLGPKVCVFWGLLKERKSWQKVYADGIY